MRRILWAFALMAHICSVAEAEEAFRLRDAVDTPAWLTLKGETRVRYETLQGQFRAGGEGGDQLLLFRSLLLAEADTGPISFGVEIQDSRTYLADAGTPLSSTLPYWSILLTVSASFCPGLSKISPGMICSATALEAAGFAAAMDSAAVDCWPLALPKQ